MGTNDLFMQMCKEATEELASGEKGTWREVCTNTLILACFGMLMNHLGGRIVKPLWFFAGSVFVAVVGYFITRIIG